LDSDKDLEIIAKTELKKKELKKKKK